MNLFEYFFTNKAYLPEDLPGRLFSPLHLVVMVILFIAVPLSAWFLRKKGEKNIKTIIWIIWAVITCLEVVKIIWESCTNPNGFEVTGILPLYPCSIFMYVTPFALIGKKDAFYHRAACAFLCTIGLIGGLINFVYPVNVLSNYSVISFAGLHTLIYHASMVFVALLMLFSKYYSYKNFKDSLLGFIPILIVSIPANIINFTFGCDYMFFRGGFPFSIVADLMPEWLWVIVMYLLYLIGTMIFYLPSLIKNHKKKPLSTQPSGGN